MILSVRELDVFRLVMEHGTITAAAEALHVSQPAVTRMLQQAEDRLGFDLFVRRKRRLHPTAEARALIPETVSAFAALDIVQRRAMDLREGRAGILNIATISAFAIALLPTAIQRFRAARPDVVIALHAANAQDTAARVANHQADIGFIIDSVSMPGASFSDLCSTAFGCVMPRDHRLAGSDAVTPADLAQETIICLGRFLPLGVQAVRAFAEANVPLQTAIEVPQGAIACALVRAGAGVALMDGLGLMGSPGDDLVLRPFRPSVTITTRAVLPRLRPVSRLAKDFLATIRAVVSEREAATLR